MLLLALTNQNELRLVTDEVAHGAAYALALVCAELRDAVFARFTPQPGLPCFRTSLRDYMSTAHRMEWALSTGGRAKLNRTTTMAVARHGYLGTLRWMRANRCRWKLSSICTAAAEGGHLDVLQWVRANGWPAGHGWNGDTCAAAAGGGHLEVLQYLIAHGCSWDQSRICRGAEAAGHVEVLQWVQNHGSPSPRYVHAPRLPQLALLAPPLLPPPASPPFPLVATFYGVTYNLWLHTHFHLPLPPLPLPLAPLSWPPPHLTYSEEKATDDEAPLLLPTAYKSPHPSVPPTPHGGKCFPINVQGPCKDLFGGNFVEEAEQEAFLLERRGRTQPSRKGVPALIKAVPLNCCTHVGEPGERLSFSHFRILRDRDQTYCVEVDESGPSCYIVERVVHLEGRNVVGTGIGAGYQEASKAATDDAMRIMAY